MRQLFISDLHLWDQKPQIEKLFMQFMEKQATEADELYVLGDLFEAWIGDDALYPMADRVIATFKQFSNKGGRLFFIRGNRDFLLGSEFAYATGGIILHQPHLLNIAGQKSILMHGDSLCTEDHEYIAFREQSRSTEWQEQFLSQSVEERLLIARQIRDTSISKRRQAVGNMGDVVQTEVINLMKTSAATLMIHGHTHRQARHNFTVDGQAFERIVLGDWGETGSVLTVQDDEIELCNFSLAG